MPRVPIPQGKRWCFTLNNPTEEEYAAIMALECKYLICGREIGEHGTPHLQGFIVFLTNKRLNAARQAIPRAHLEIARGTTDQAADYCSKDGNYAEKGTRPRNALDQARDQKEKWTDIIRSARAGTTEDEYPREFIQYNAVLGRLYQPSIQALDSFSGLWFYGKPGAGKSRLARYLYPESYDKLLNKWWDGYVDEETVLIDDIGQSHQLMGHFLKRYADHYPFRAEFKGGSKVIRPKRIIVTSNYKIEEIWRDDKEMIAALNRRFKTTNFNLGEQFVKPNFDIVS